MVIYSKGLGEEVQVERTYIQACFGYLQIAIDNICVPVAMQYCAYMCMCQDYKLSVPKPKAVMRLYGN